ncbi:MAG: hypothetical protein N2376_08835 [Clostridia bacterium]|nr:hypothetical protein [Clostridia bacterium]
MDYVIQGAILILFASGALMLWRNTTQKVSATPKMRLDRYKAILVKEFQNPETDRLVKGLGLNSGLLYQVIRTAILLGWVGLLFYRSISAKGDMLLPVIIWILAFLVSSPRRTLFKKDSPFFIIVNQIQKRKRHKLNLEIYRCLSQLKNMVVAKANRSYSADSLILELAKYTVHAKPIFNRMLGYWYEGRYEEATNYFSEAIGTKDAAALASLLSKIDYLKPSEFLSQIELYQAAAKDDRKTASHAVKENRSNLLYTLVMASGILIFINLIVITIGVDYKLSKFFIF